MALKVINGVWFNLISFNISPLNRVGNATLSKFFAVWRSSQPSLRFQEMEPLNVLFRWILIKGVHEHPILNSFEPNALSEACQ